jgi:hypothetical protein
MGYELHITRKVNWFDEQGARITEQEWRAYVASDSEMVMSGVAEDTDAQGETIRITHPLLTEWRRQPSGLSVWFSYFAGNLSVKNPDEACVAKMTQVAKKLGARVQGDDGETYDENGRPPRLPTLSPLSFGQRLASWFSHLRPQRPKHQHVPLPFRVGDNVRDVWGNEHTVISIDPKAEHGMGVIRTRRSDGSEHSLAMIAHGLTRAPKS